jgi:anaerobic selenocysteine-containing dehydrogenase
MAETPASPKGRIRTTCPRDCYDACGIVVMTRDGAITKVVGDPEHPRSRGALCAKCALAYNGAWLDPAQRLATPLVRTGPKGSGQFAPVSWDTALSTIAAQLHGIVAEHGAASVLHTHYTGTVALLAGNFPGRFFNRLGATEVDPDTVCNKAGHETLKLVFGDSFQGFDPRSVGDARCVLVWGANPSASAPHVHKHWLADAKKHAKLIVVDPIAHGTAKLADLHLQPFPGTDAALAFALLHVLRRDGFVDRGFVARSVAGFDAIEQARWDGRTLDDLTPAWAERVTGVPAAKIEAAAAAYGAGPSMLWMGQGLQRQPRAAAVMRAITLLPAATGHIGKPGAGILYMNAYQARGIDTDWLSGTALRRTSAASISHMDLPAALNDPTRSRALFTWNNNIAASSPDQNTLRRGLVREDLFHVAVELFATDTTQFADVVLPAASFLEHDDLVLSYFDYSTSAQAKAGEPPGDALPNTEVFRRLARAMGFDDAPLFESDASMIATLLAQTGCPLDFDALRARGTVPWSDAPVVRFTDGCFPTPSGRIEVGGARFTEVGLPALPAPDADAVPSGGRVRVLSPSSEWLMNSSYANDARIAERLGARSVFVHPDEARARGLTDGAPVVLSNATGRMEGVLGVDDGVPRHVALVPKGRWPKHDPRRGNVNFLHPPRKTDFAESTAVHGIEADLVAVSTTPEPATTAAPAVA